MDRKIIDVLPPYEDEVLVSWIVRMLRLYRGTEKFHDDSSQLMKALFGDSSTEKPGLYYQSGLQYFADNCGMTFSKVFSSERTILEELSVLPFYLLFCNEEHIDEFHSKHGKRSYIQIESRSGIRRKHNILGKKSEFKFCPECLREQSEIYLKKEHQIQGNCVCWKHGCILHSVPYKTQWKYIDFVYNIEQHINESEYIISPESYEMAEKIASTIHMIFEDGFKDDINTLKQKIMARLIELNHVNDKGLFIDLEQFADNLKVGYIYNKEELFSEIGYAIGEKLRPNPLIYIILIIVLFGGLKEYNAYEKTILNVKLHKKGTILNNHFWLNKNKKFIIRISEREFLNEYYIVGDTDKNIIVQHKKCGHTYFISKCTKDFTACKKCKDENTILSNEKKEIVIASPCHFLMTSEYGTLHNKKAKQIFNCCRDNKIPGVIKVNNFYLIPEKAPYPKDKRIKNKQDNKCVSKRKAFEKTGLCKNEIDYFVEHLPEKFFDEHCILGDTEDFIIVQHLKCGRIYRISKLKKKLHKCYCCSDKKDFGQLLEIKKNKQIMHDRYLSPQEYAAIHKKSVAQILKHCKDNRFPDVLRIGRECLIPENSPYPKDRRFKN